MRVLSALLLAALFVAVPVLSAQSTGPEILAQLKGKPLFLRGCWAGQDLDFDHVGNLTGAQAPWSFTLSGIDVDKAEFTGNDLEITGRRVGIEFGKDGTPRRVNLKWKHFSGKVTLRIAGQAGDDFGPALQKIFAPDLPELLPSIPDYWKTVGEHYVQDASVGGNDDNAEEWHAGASAQANGLPMKPETIEGNVIPPAVIRQPKPSYSDAARGAGYSGNVEVYLWVGPSGIPSHLTVVKAAGLGLDENALAAVAGYRFKPATRDGVPVTVDLYIDVNFQIF